MRAILNFARAFGLQLVISGIIGAGIVMIIQIGGGGRLTSNLLLSGAVVGTTIWACCTAMARLLWSRLLALPTILKLPAFGAVFMFGGAAGWVISSFISLWLLGVRYASSPESVAISIGITGAIAVAVGGAISTIQLLRQRLEQSISELKEKEYTEKEIETAAAIQRRLLPPEELEIAGLTISSRHIPARQVAGDFYDVFRTADGPIAVVIADVVGKGIGASLIMASVKATLPFVGANLSVPETLRKLNRRLAEELGPREFVALALIHLDPSTQTFRLGNAGLPDPYLLRDGERPKPLSVSGPRLPLGVFQDVVYEVLELPYDQSDRLLLLTDGAPESTGPDGSPLGYERFEDLVNAAHGHGHLDLDRLVSSLRSATAGDPDDDWTLVSVSPGHHS